MPTVIYIPWVPRHLHLVVLNPDQTPLAHWQSKGHTRARTMSSVPRHCSHALLRPYGSTAGLPLTACPLRSIWPSSCLCPCPLTPAISWPRPRRLALINSSCFGAAAPRRLTPCALTPHSLCCSRPVVNSWPLPIACREVPSCHCATSVRSLGAAFPTRTPRPCQCSPPVSSHPRLTSHKGRSVGPTSRAELHWSDPEQLSLADPRAPPALFVSAPATNTNCYVSPLSASACNSSLPPPPPATAGVGSNRAGVRGARVICELAEHSGPGSRQERRSQ